jgi:hypothetical protein
MGLQRVFVPNHAQIVSFLACQKIEIAIFVEINEFDQVEFRAFGAADVVRLERQGAAVANLPLPNHTPDTTVSAIRQHQVAVAIAVDITHSL